MDSKIYRKVALERMSSPEQLDRLLHVTSPKSWLALFALVALLGVAVAWGFMGQLATSVPGAGVLIRSGGVQSVVPLGAGQVLEIKVRVGDHITVGQVIGTVAQPSLLERIRGARARLDDALKEKDQVFQVRSDNARLQLEFLKRQRANLELEIEDLRKQVKMVEEQIPVDEELLSKGLITRQQVYQTRQKLIAIQTDISSRQAQLTQVDASVYQAEKGSVEANLVNENKITDLKREVRTLEIQLATESKVVSPYAGQVLEVKVSPGALVQVGTPVLSLHPDVEKLEALVYVPAAKAKEVRAGMDAEISPTTVKREEFGFIRGKVSGVSEYPATEEALMRIYENAPLVRSLGAGGPVTEVRVDMQSDPATPSGFRWSSPQGAPVKLSGGTMCLAEIVTRRQKPIDMVFPYVKEKMGMR
jgi:HlyD family secretion protein